MKGLNEAQLQDLTTYMQESLRRYNALEEELIDHLACLIEEKMDEGWDYTSARRHALEVFNKDEVKRTEGRALYFVHTKPVLMKCFLLLGVGGMTALLFWLQQPAVDAAHVQASNSALVRDAAPQMVSGSTELIANLTAFAFSAEKLHQGVQRPEEPPVLYPLPESYEVSSAYGMRIHPIYKKKILHRGIDIKAPKGTPVVATADGVVEFAEREHNYGLKIVIRHDDQYQSMYAHLGEIKVKAGERITKGSVIAVVGSTGNSTAPHLHYEVVKDGKPVNPSDYLPRS
jgi:hypothetical protein